MGRATFITSRYFLVHDFTPNDRPTQYLYPVLSVDLCLVLYHFIYREIYPNQMSALSTSRNLAKFHLQFSHHSLFNHDLLWILLGVSYLKLRLLLAIRHLFISRTSFDFTHSNHRLRHLFHLATSWISLLDWGNRNASSFRWKMDLVSVGDG